MWENTTDEVDAMIDANVKGVLNGVRAVVPGMLARGRGHVIPIGSTAAHAVYPGGVVYCATKHAVLAIANGLKADLHGTPIRVSRRSRPGWSRPTSRSSASTATPSAPTPVYSDTVALTPEDVADAVVYCAHAPDRVNVQELLLTPRVQSNDTMIARGEDADRVEGR